MRIILIVALTCGTISAADWLSSALNSTETQTTKSVNKAQGAINTAGVAAKTMADTTKKLGTAVTGVAQSTKRALAVSKESLKEVQGVATNIKKAFSF